MSGIQALFQLELGQFSLDLELDLPGRGVTVLFGPSGSGKTLLLRCIAGLERARGRLSVNGERWQDEKLFLPTHRRPLGYVFQEPSLFPHLSVQGNLEFGMKRASRSNGEALEQAIELLGIGHLLRRRPGRLSGGEQQRVAIARAIAVQPRLLLMDEPLAALDLARKREILPYLEQLHDRLEIPLLYVTHSPDEMARLADHLVVLEGGRVLASGPLTDTLARLDLPVRLGEEAGVVLEARIEGRDRQWGLASAAFPGGRLLVKDIGIPVGNRVRLRVLAKDVSLALERQEGSSILNLLPATVAEVGEGEHPATALVRLKLGESTILASLTRRSVHALELEAGKAVWVQIKSVAVIE